MAYKPSDWEKKLFGKVDGRKVKDKKKYYDRAMDQEASNYRSANKLKESTGEVKNKLLNHYHDREKIDDFMRVGQTRRNRLYGATPETRAKNEHKAANTFLTSKNGGRDKVDQYHEARKQMGYNADSGEVTKKKYESMFGSAKTGDKGLFGRFQEYQNKQNKPSSSKEEGSSFDVKVDKGLDLLKKGIKKISPSVKEVTDNKLLKTFYNNSSLRGKVETAKLALKGMDKVDQYGGASSTRNVLENATDNKNQSTKEYLQAVKDGFTGKRRASGEEIAKNLGVKSRYGAKLTGFGIEALADPTNLVGVGAYKAGAKAFKGVSKLEDLTKVAEEVKTVSKTTNEPIKTPKKEQNVAKLQQAIEKLPKKEQKALNIEPIITQKGKGVPKRPKGTKVSKRQEPNGVLMAEGLPLPLAKGKLDPKTAPLAKVDKVKKVTTSEKVIKNEKELQELQDIKTFQTGTKNLYEVAERLPTSQRDRIVNDLDTAKVNNVNYQKAHTDDLFNKLVKGKGIKKGSKESALIQDFGEKTLAKKYLTEKGIDVESVPKEELAKINLSILKKQRPKDWEDFVNADEYFKGKYKEHLTNVNNTRSQIYPNQPDRLVPEREDYYHHFNEMEGLEGVMNQFSSPANIDPKLVGISHRTKPNSKFQGFMQKRGLGPYKSDAIGGYLKYLQAASHSINVDPVISTVKGVSKEIAEATGDTKNANNIIEALQDHAGDLAGKTNPFDRVLLKAGRKTVNIANTVNNRVKTNMILGNLGSALGQFGNIPLAIGKAKHHSVTGLGDTLGQLGKFLTKGEKNAPIHQSNFMKERFLGKDYARFDQKLIEQPKKLAVWMLEAADQAGTSFTWNSMYRKGLAEKVSDPVKYADAETRKLIGGRGVGEMPLIQKSKTAQIFMPFTYEVGNQWRVLKDMVGEKDAAGIITFLVASYGLNKAMEEVRGSGVSFDPLDALLDGYRDKEGNVPHKILAAVGSLSGEVIGNIPGGNLAINSLGDKKIKGTDLTVNEIFQDRNPNRFGTGLTASKIIENPSFLFAPFGANQIKKSIEGTKAVMDKGVYKPNGEMMYPIEPEPGLSGLMKMMQLGTMGKYSSSEGKDYFKNDRRPLSAKQTERVDDKKTPEERLKEYALILKERKERAEKRKQ